MSFILNHSTLGWGIMDILALVLLLGISIYAYLRLKALKRQKQELAEHLAGEQAEEATTDLSKVQ